MRIEQLQYVITIAECRSLSRAARDLFITQPTLSVSLQNLEAELGFQIFKRSHMGMELTEKGQEFYQIALRIHKELQRIHRLTEDAPANQEVHLVAVPAFCSGAMHALLAQIKTDLPELLLSISEVSRSNLLPALLEQRADLCVGVFIGDEEQQLMQSAAQNSIVIEPLMQDEMYIYLGPAHALAHDEQVFLSDLNNTDMLLFRDDKTDDEISHRPSGSYYRFSDRDSLMKAVSKNLGYAVLPSLMSYDNLYVETGLISVLPMADGEISATFYLAYSSATPLSESAQQVANRIRTLSRDIHNRVRRMPASSGSNQGKTPAIFY